MTPQEIKTLLSNIKYKPGFSLDLRSSDEPYVIRIAATVPNSRENSAHPIITMALMTQCDSRTSPQRLLFDIAMTIAQIEIHESLEYFKYNNKLIFDPHKFKEDPICVRQPWDFYPEDVEL